MSTITNATRGGFISLLFILLSFLLAILKISGAVEIDWCWVMFPVACWLVATLSVMLACLIMMRMLYRAGLDMDTLSGEER